MLEKLNEIVEQFQQLEVQLADSEIITDPNKLREVSKEHSRLQPIVSMFGDYKELQQSIDDDRAILAENNDPELVEIAELELSELEPKIEDLEQQLKKALVPPDPNDDRNAILEIRAGAGGDEAGLFAGDIYRMYGRFAERQGWKIEVLNSNPQGIGGFKEIIALVKGGTVFGKLKYEGGVHRVQRVPATETSGRVHTSAATVAVLPEAEDVDVDIANNDLRIDVYRSSGPGGQSVNTTDSAVRITHVPTGLVVTCQDEKSQHKNKAKALKVLRSRLLEIKQREEQEKITADRRQMVGSGDRSAKIRTYNFPQGRVTDHRINLTLYQLDSVLDGGLDEFVEQLSAYDKNELLKAASTTA